MVVVVVGDSDPGGNGLSWDFGEIKRVVIFSDIHLSLCSIQIFLYILEGLDVILKKI